MRSSCRYGHLNHTQRIPYLQPFPCFGQSMPILCSRRSTHLCLCACISPLNHVLFVCFSIGLRRLAGSKRLLKVSDDVVNVLSANRNTDEVFRNPAVCLLFVAELLMCCRPGMNSQSLRVANTCQLLEPVQIRGLRKPYFARFEISLKPSTTCWPAASPPFTPNESTPPNPLGKYFFASECDWCFSSPG